MGARVLLVEANPRKRIGSYKEIAEAEKVVTTDGRVIKDRDGDAPRPATAQELRAAAMEAEGVGA